MPSRIPKNYQSVLSIKETQIGIKLIKDTFEMKLANALNLRRVSAPLFVTETSGLNDHLSGHERPVSFYALDMPRELIEIVHSLAKWKRQALGRYQFEIGEGLYTDMNAIRREEQLDNTHSMYVDQWDWELVISKDMRTLSYLKSVVERIYEAFLQTHQILHEQFRQLPQLDLPKQITFISSQDLENLYPGLDAKLRENAYSKKHGAIFIYQIGSILDSGKPHDNRAADYDDWELNGDFIVWYPLLEQGVELSSMGIRVDAQSLEKQFNHIGKDKTHYLTYHHQVDQNQIPLTIGGGIGQSRLCMVLLNKAHVGEVQASLWNEQTINICNENNVELL